MLNERLALLDDLARRPPEARDALKLDPEIADAVEEYAAMRHDGARRRLGRYLVRRLPDAAWAALMTAVHGDQAAHAATVELDHRAEHWRDRLIAEGGPAMAALAAQCPNLGDLTGLVSVAQSADAGPAGKKARRDLYRALRRQPWLP